MTARPRRLGREHLPALAGYAVVTTAFLWPGVRHFTTRVLSAGGDGSTFLWAYWSMPRAALRLENPFVTDLLFHPVGAHLAFHTTTPLEMAVSWPIARLFGLGVAVNVLQLAAAMLSALGAYFLALHVCGDRRAAFFAGVAFAFVPYRFVHAGSHLNLIHTQFLPFGLLAVLRLLEKPSRARAVAFGIVVGLTFLTDFYYTVFLLLGAGVLVLFSSAGRRVPTALRWRRLAQAAAVASVVALPLLVPMIHGLTSGELDPLQGWGGADIRSADLISWVFPWEHHALWGSAVTRVREALPARGEGVVYPGLVVLGLAVAGRELVDRDRRRGFVALAITAAVLAMGPFLQVGGHAGAGFSYLGRHFAFPLPFLALRFVPLLNGVRVPARFAILAILALDVLAATTLAAIARRRPSVGAPVVVVAVAVLLVELLPGRVGTHPVRVPGPYHAIAADEGRGAVLEVPLQWQSGVAVVGDKRPPRDDTIFLYYATVHGRPLVSGHVSRYPSERLERMKSVPVYRQILALSGERGFEDPAVFDAGDLRELAIGYVVYHRDRPQPAAFEYLARLGLEPLADDGTVLVWKV